MNRIEKKPLSQLGFGFVDAAFLQDGQTEFDHRNKTLDLTKYRPLQEREINILEANLNEAENWKDVWVKNGFNPYLVKNCRFFGINRIGVLENCYLEFKNLRMPVGIYNSTIISSDFGDNVAIDRVNLLSHYQIGNEVMILQVNELATTPTAKFGNGIVKEGEEERIRIWMELGNENGGRKVVPFENMQLADAYLWTQNRDDLELQSRFLQMTQKEFSKERGFYGQIGDRTVIKNTGIIKDVKIGTDAYIKGANKLKNLTIFSNEQSSTQIGEGCEIVNGIIHEGCRIFYGVKAVRFILESHSQLKYGARLINSYLGNNSTISCCEVLNALIFPAHEQHHNNSFLCAALIKGQSNMAAGATLGSNHNSRAADGELQTGRGFWPGLSVSLKHNSKFASFNLISKGNYPAEIHNPLPFSLLGNDDKTGGLLIIAAYWFQYNLYALARNAWKFEHRDQRINKDMLLEYDFLAPDTIFEMMESLQLLCFWVGDSLDSGGQKTKDQRIDLGKSWLENPANEEVQLDVWATGIENTKRKTRIAKSYKAYHIFKDLIYYHAAKEWLKSTKKPIIHTEKFLNVWENLGGQLVKKSSIDALKASIKSGVIQEWNQVHDWYRIQANKYPQEKLEQAMIALEIVSGKNTNDPIFIKQWFKKAEEVSLFIYNGILHARKKDYDDPFRLAMFENPNEMNAVLGNWNENEFILEAKKSHEEFINQGLKRS